MKEKDNKEENNNILNEDEEVDKYENENNMVKNRISSNIDNQNEDHQVIEELPQKCNSIFFF